jgi:hypothetical protein
MRDSAPKKEPKGCDAHPLNPRGYDLSMHAPESARTQRLIFHAGNDQQ